MATRTTLPAAFTVGQVLTSTQMNDLRGAFRVLQVVAATPATAQVTSSTNTYVTTGLSATITPSSTSSKVLCIVQQSGCGKESSNTFVALRLDRAGSSISQIEGYGAFDNTAGINYVGTIGTVFLDSPATVAATTYETYVASGANSSLVSVQANSGASTMILMEISA